MLKPKIVWDRNLLKVAYAYQLMTVITSNDFLPLNFPIKSSLNNTA